jgi:hypothetical protein
MGRPPVAYERRRRGVIFGVDGGLADGAGLAGGGRIDGTAGEVDGGARLAACRWLRSGACEKASKQQEGWRGRSSARWRAAI